MITIFAGDFAQASYSCNQIAKYNDIDDDDVIEAAGLVEDAMQSLQSRRQSSSLQVRACWSIGRPLHIQFNLILNSFCIYIFSVIWLIAVAGII